MHDPLPKVIRSAFNAASRQLIRYKEQKRMEIKPHPQREAMALIARLFPQDGYGFLKTLDGRDIYFHRNSILHNDFDRLEIGTAVRFAEEMGEKGPQASSVQITDKPGTTRSHAGKRRSTPFNL